MDEFRAGVTASLRSWSALRTAVESGWGGNESIQKAEDLRNNIFDHFNGSSVPPKTMIDVTDLEDALAIFMEEEFSVVLDDGSERQVADVIWKMYEACSTGDLTLANQVVSVAEQAAAKLQSFPVQVQSPEQCDDDDGDDEEDAMDTTTTEESTSSVAAVPQHQMNSPLLVATAVIGIPSLATTTAAEYAAQPLFGPVKRHKPVVEKPPPRQLGEAAPSMAETKIPVDEDGFAPIIKQKRKTRKPV
jgi:pre-rRNA-processing protein TSR2